MKALVTGGGGFLGRAIVQRLLARGDSVRIFARGEYPDLAAQGVEVLRGDVQDASAVAAACKGCDTVFHVAGRPGIAKRYTLYHGPNVVGTDNVLAGCRAHGIGRLIFTSSASVIFHGGDMEGVDESVPYPEHYEAYYPRSKAMAEQNVLAANSPDLATVSIRPHLIWGPGDTQLLPRIIARAKTLRRIGPVDKKVDSTYVDDAADAHLLACHRLRPGSPIAGRAYFISQGEPRGVWELVNGILAAAGLPPVTRSVPRWAALAAGATLEAVHWLARLDTEPRFTRFLVRELSTAHWFNIAAARRDLGYAPRVTVDEGLRRLANWLKGPTAPNHLRSASWENPTQLR